MNFYSRNKTLEDKIREKVINSFLSISDLHIREILIQRQKTSCYIKGISSYHIFKGMASDYDENRNIELSKNLEIWSTGLVILDNISDSHKVRNNATTYLKEFGVEKSAIAACYATHLGLIDLSEYIYKLNLLTSDFGSFSVAKSVDGAINMDMNHPTLDCDILDAIARVNGLTLSLPLSISAIAANDDKEVIFDILKYGYDTGIAFGLFEELRDLVGIHGREKASEIKSGRVPYYLARAKKIDPKIDLKRFVGKNLDTKDYINLISILEKTSAIEHTSKLIKNHLEYGRKRIEWRLSKESYYELDLLRKTTEVNLANILLSLKNISIG